MDKKLLYLNRRAPYGSIYAQEALEVVLIGAAFDQDVSLLFIDDGVLQLKRGQETSTVGMKNFSPTFGALEMYDVEKLYVSREALAARGMRERDLMVGVTVLSDAEIADLMDEQDAILSF